MLAPSKHFLPPSPAFAPFFFALALDLTFVRLLNWETHADGVVRVICVSSSEGYGGDRLEVYSNVVEGMGSNTLPTYTDVIMDWSCTKWERKSMEKGKLIIGEKYYT